MGLIGKLKKWKGLWENQSILREITSNKCVDNGEVIIIKLDAIGDFIIWLDSAKEYRGMYPKRKIVLLCSSVCQSLADITGYFDETISINMAKFESDQSYRNNELNKLRQREFGLLIQTAYSRTQHMDIIAAAIPASRKIGFVSDESKSNVSRYMMTKKNRRRADAFYDELIMSRDANKMELQRNADLIKGLGNVGFCSSTPKLPAVEYKPIYQSPYFVVFPGASTHMKMWSIANYIEVINHVLEKTNWDVVICGGANEVVLYSQIKKEIENPNRIIDCCGKVSLVDLIEVVRGAQLVISNDTSGIHYAAATGVPAVCPFGEYNYGRFLPYEADCRLDRVIVCSANMPCRNCASKGMTCKCIVHILRKGRYRCLDLVTVSMVKEAVNKLL